MRRILLAVGLLWLAGQAAIASAAEEPARLALERNQRPVRTASVWQARQPVYQTSVERWRRYEPWLGCLRELLPAPK